MVGAGFLASAIGMYSFAARVGLVPADFSSVVRGITGISAPSLSGTSFGTNSPGVYPPAAAGAGTYPVDGRSAAGYQTIGYPAATYGGGDIACYFSPSGGCTEAVVAEIRQARQQIFVQAYSFTSVPIANALVDAHNRGVAVYIILDKSQRTEQYSGADFVARAGIPTLIDAVHAIAHNKIMLIDGLTIITGSFNFTTNAEQHNAENLLVIRNRPDLYQAYAENFRRHFEHSQPYQGRGMSSQPPLRGIIATEAARFLSDAETEVANNLAEQWSQQAQASGPAGYPGASYSR
jgi:phosphatidylserine/phosphatidylglycerophosphate/cardiolipin synthase-like enzyme